MKKIGFHIDVVGNCNLKCPSCPNNHSFPSRPAKASCGVMSTDLFAEILQKVTRECSVGYLNLFVWGEPLLHPRLCELLAIASDHHLRVGLSTNLTTEVDYARLLQFNPDRITVSTSGFTQEIYSVAHAGGNVETVKRNLRKLAEAKRLTHADTVINIAYHLYSYNIDEAALMQKLAVGAGCIFTPYWAGWGCLEYYLEYFYEQNPEIQKILNEVYSVKLPFTLPEVISLLSKFRRTPCHLQEDDITMDSDGNVMLCCNVYGHRLGKYLDHDLADFLNLKSENRLCTLCKGLGMHRYDFNPELDKLVPVEILERISSLPGFSQNDPVHKKVGRFLKKVTRILK